MDPRRYARLVVARDAISKAIDGTSAQVKQQAEDQFMTDGKVDVAKVRVQPEVTKDVGKVEVRK